MRGYAGSFEDRQPNRRVFLYPQRMSNSRHRIGYQSEKFLLRLRDIILHFGKLHNSRNGFAVTFFFTSDCTFVLAVEIALLNAQNFGLREVGPA